MRIFLIVFCLRSSSWRFLFIDFADAFSFFFRCVWLLPPEYVKAVCLASSFFSFKSSMKSVVTFSRVCFETVFFTFGNNPISVFCLTVLHFDGTGRLMFPPLAWFGSILLMFECFVHVGHVGSPPVRIESANNLSRHIQYHDFDSIRSRWFHSHEHHHHHPCHVYPICGLQCCFLRCCISRSSAVSCGCWVSMHP